MKTLIGTFFIFLLAINSYGQQLAFPTAEGFGAYSKGGRGGNVFYVTNLNDKGPGSLRWAVEHEGPRTVVFAISGTIDLKSRLTIENPFITIAGQTAPGDGICLRGETVQIEADHVIIRYIQVRLGDGMHGQGSLQGKDAISISSGKNIIIDHCSASWSLDEVLSSSTKNPDLTNITVQWCFITEGLNPDGHGFGSLIRGTGGAKYSFLHNLYAHNRGRNPRPGNYDTNPYNEDPEGLLLDFRNNVLYNWGGRHAGYNNDKKSVTKLNYIANYLIPGVDSEDNGIAYSTGSPYNRACFIGNYYNDKKPKNQWSLVNFKNNWSKDEIENYKQDEPFEPGPIVEEDALMAFERVLNKGGAILPKRDAVDTRIVKDVRNRTGKIIKSQEEIGGWPKLKTEHAQKDTDKDGMPDKWEMKKKLNPNDASDGAKDRNGNGYTNLEEYLNRVVSEGISQINAQSSSKKAIVLEEFVFKDEPTRDCHASSILELANGDLLCVWFGGTRERHPDVNLWLARKPKGGKWQKPVSVSDGDGKTLFNPVLVQLKGGDIQIYFLSPGIDDGQVITSCDNGYTWSKMKNLPEGFTGPLVNKPVYMDDGTIIAGASLQGEPGKRIHAERSTDNGKTWTKTESISDPVNTKYKIIQPTILVHSQQKLQILARPNASNSDTKLAQTWSEDGGLTWSPVSDAALPNNNSAVDAVTLDDGRHLLVYNHSTRENPVGGRKGRGILTVALSNDGINWEAAAVLEYRTGQVQYSYPAVIQTKDGLVHVTYSWHRKRIKHVVIDPKKLETYPIVNGQWPKDKMPWIKSAENIIIGEDSEVLK